MKLSTNRRTTSYSNSLGRLVVTLTKKTMTETERALGLAFMGLQMAWYLLGNSLGELFVIYRVTHHVDSNLQLSPKQRLRLVHWPHTKTELLF